MIHLNGQIEAFGDVLKLQYASFENQAVVPSSLCIYLKISFLSQSLESGADMTSHKPNIVFLFLFFFMCIFSATTGIWILIACESAPVTSPASVQAQQ